MKDDVNAPSPYETLPTVQGASSVSIYPGCRGEGARGINSSTTVGVALETLIPNARLALNIVLLSGSHTKVPLLHY